MTRRRSKNSKRWLFGLLAVLALTLLLSLGKRGFIAQVRVRMEKKQLEKTITALEDRKRALEEENTKLDDPKYIEKIAREEYGMGKKNEKVYRVVPKEE